MDMKFECSVTSVIGSNTNTANSSKMFCDFRRYLPNSASSLLLGRDAVRCRVICKEVDSFASSDREATVVAPKATTLLKDYDGRVLYSDVAVYDSKKRPHTVWL